MDAGKLNTRIEVQRLSKTSDNYGGTTSTTYTAHTLWAYKRDLSGDISDTEGKRGRSVEIELQMRKKAADQILDNDILKIQNKTGLYRINSIYDSKQDFFTVIKASKLD